MQNLPELRVVPLTEIMPHENVDPLRVERLAARISAEGTQLNPMVCIEDISGRFVLLDGATRTAALGNIGLAYGVVQVVAAQSITLGTWHHVVRNAAPEAVMSHIEDSPNLTLTGDEGPPRISTIDGGRSTARSDRLTENGVLSTLVDCYIGRWTVNRVVDADLDSVASLYPDWATVFEFPTLTVDDVMKAALGDDRLPAGITRFMVPDRALRVRAELAVLAPGPQEERQALLDRLLEERSNAGRIRRYPQSVVIYDE
ncbi:MAG: bifunctional transcriptional regulator/O-phospho-L-serine synthase SbnI [Acidimicrobiia bacterium]|nr:MAG: bifunctional transcriptional regulator/O-phospho-L-serine synthase SbnI [Acidimicrobiia bacterium]